MLKTLQQVRFFSKSGYSNKKRDGKYLIPVPVLDMIKRLF